MDVDLPAEDDPRRLDVRRWFDEHPSLATAGGTNADGPVASTERSGADPGASSATSIVVGDGV